MKNLDLATEMYYNHVVFAMAMEEDFDYSIEHLYELNMVANVEEFRKFIEAKELDDDELFDYCLDDSDEECTLYHKMYSDLDAKGFNLI